MEPYNSKITVNLGLEEYDKGKNKITHEIFEGRDKTQNAELFIENLHKTKQRHQEETKQNKQQEEEEEEKPALDEDTLKTDHQEKVIMDLNPKNFDKKDHIFMDFFSMYGQNFIESKRA